MARTSSSSVQGVLLGDYDGTATLTVFIDTASLLVDRMVTCASNKDITFTDAELELIERWLAAHCYAMSDQPFSEKKTGNSSAKFQGQTKMYLEATKYGQMAVALDYSGCLGSVTTRARAGLFWGGKRPSDQIDYVDRD